VSVADAGRLLELLIVAEQPIPLLALADVDRLGVSLVPVIDGAADAGLIDVAHGLVALTPAGRGAAEMPGPIRSAEVHALLGRLLADRPAVSPSRVVRHRLASLTAGVDADAVVDGVRVGRDALDAGELDDAVSVFAAVLGALDQGAYPAAARVEALSGLASALAWSGRGDEAQRMLDDAVAEAVRTGDPHQLAAVALGWVGRSIAIDDDPTNTALIDLALRAIEDAEASSDASFHVIRAQLLGVRADRTVFADLDVARRSAIDARTLALETGDADTIVRTTFSQHLTHWHPSTQAASLALADEMVALSPSAVNHAEYGSVVRLQVFLETGDFERFDSELRALDRRVSGRPRRFERVWLHTLLGARALVRGDWADVDTQVAAARELAAGFDYEALDQLLLAQQMLVGWHQGMDLSVLVTNDALPAGSMRASWAACLLGLSAEQLSPDEVERHLVRHLGGGIDAIRPDLTWGPVVACLGMAAVQARATRYAEMLVAAIEPYADQWASTGGAVCFGPFALHLGRLLQVLGRVDAAVQHLRSALEACVRAEARPWTARVLTALAMVDSAHANEHAIAARELADSLAMPAVVKAADRQLSALGRPALPAGLTAREAEVLAHVADGLTNKDIGARLYLSVKTVERHLLNAYNKIGVRNRSEATAFVVRHGLARSESERSPGS
jgi:DNA-binding CsgD family transcriptional regulator